MFDQPSELRMKNNAWTQGGLQKSTILEINIEAGKQKNESLALKNTEQNYSFLSNPRIEIKQSDIYNKNL